MPPIGVGEGWTPSPAQALLLELNGNQAHDLPLIEKALNVAAGTDTSRISQLENALRVKSEEFDRVSEGLRSLQDGTEVTDLRARVEALTAAAAESAASLAEANAKATTERGLLSATVQEREKRIAEQDEELSRLKGGTVPEAPPTGAASGGASAALVTSDSTPGA